MEFDILIVSGFSGSGKGTILKKLLSFHPELELIKSYTTRQKRNDADFYSFVTPEEFMSLRRANYFLECNQYSGEWYGTPIHAVQSCVNKGKIAVIEIDSNGFRQIMGALLARKYRVLSVFIVADADTIIKRLLNRNTENLEKILLRSKSSLDECEWIVYYDLILPNYGLDESVTTFEKAIFTGTIPKMTFNVEEYKHRMKHLIYLLSD